MKTWYVFVRDCGYWIRYTDVNAESANDAIDRCRSGINRRYPTSGHIRAFSKNNLPWEK